MKITSMILISFVCVYVIIQTITPRNSAAVAAEIPLATRQQQYYYVYLPIIVRSLNFQILNGDFEAVRDYWIEYSQNGWLLILDAADLKRQPHSGNYAAWLGGANSEIASIEQSVTIPQSNPYLVFWEIRASDEANCGYDLASVWINGSTKVAAYDLCAATNKTNWVQNSINLTGYIGQRVAITFRLDTDSSYVSNWYLDDINLQSNP